MQITREKLSLMLALDYVKLRIYELTTSISNMDVMNDDIGVAFDERSVLQDIASVLEIRLGYVYNSREYSYSNLIIEDANLIQKGFLKRLEGC